MNTRKSINTKLPSYAPKMGSPKSKVVGYEIRDNKIYPPSLSGLPKTNRYDLVAYSSLDPSAEKPNPEEKNYNNSSDENYYYYLSLCGS